MMSACLCFLTFLILLQLRYINHSDRDIILANLLVCRLNSHLWALRDVEGGVN